MASQHHLHDELDYSSNLGSVSSTSSPRLDYQHHHPRPQQHTTHDLHAQVRLMCSFGGKISPRLHDNRRLCYAGGESRIIAIHRATTYSTLLAKLSKLSGMMVGNINVKYQLPYEDLDALISVSNDEDVENMIEEYDRFAQNQYPGPVRLRLFLFKKREENRPADTGSMDLHGSADQEQWLLGTPSEGESAYATRLKSTRSEVSSFASQLSNSQIGLDNDDQIQFSGPKWKTLSELSDSDLRALDPASAPYVSLTGNLPHVITRPGAPSISTKSRKDQSNNFMEIVTCQASYSGRHAPNPHQFEPTCQPEPVYSIIDPMETNNACIVSPVPIHIPYLIPYSSSSGQTPLVGYHQPVSMIGHAYNPITRSIREMDISHEPDDGSSRSEHLYY